MKTDISRIIKGMSEEEKKGLIDGVECALDFRLDLPEEDFLIYKQIIEERSENEKKTLMDKTEVKIEAKSMEELNSNRKKAITHLQELVYYFADSLLEEEDAERKEAEEYKRKCEEEPNKLNFRISAHEQNEALIKKCIREARDAIRLLSNKENVIEEWQIAGINGMFEQCNTDKIIPYDLPAAVKGILFC